MSKFVNKAIMKKIYNNAELQIVRVNNNDIVTASNPNVTIGGKFTGTPGQIDAPGRRSIWD